MKNFWQRILTGTIFIAIVLSSVWEGPVLFQVVFLLVSLLSLEEFYKLTTSATRQPNKVAGLVTGAVTYILMSVTAFSSIASTWEVWILPSFALLFFAELYRKKEEPFTNIAFTVIGILYAVLPFALLNKIAAHDLSYDRGVLLGYFLLLWSSDSFAYVFGNLMGKHRLFERISPKKSWEGSIGGAVSTLGVAYLISTFQTQFSLINWLVIALIIVVTGTYGDLTESMLKRSLKVKDSGTILPGHGGLLDRFDGLFLSVPFVWAYIYFCS